MASPFLRPLGRAFSSVGRDPRIRLAAAAGIVAILATLLPATTVIGAVGTTAAQASVALSAIATSPDWCQPPTGQGSESEPGALTISGRVTDAAAVGLVDIWVEVAPDGQTWGRTVETNPDGTYAMHDLPDGTYRIKFFDWTGIYQGGFYAGGGLTPTPVGATTVELNGVGATVNVTLPLETPFEIHGWVKDSTGAMIEGAHLDARAVYFSMRSCGESVADGTYSVSGVRVGAYRLQVTAPGQPDGYYSSTSATGFVTSPSAATLVTVSAADVLDINIQFPETFSISGSVLDGDGAVPQGMYFGACDTTTGFCQYGEPDEFGTFTIPLLVAGDYVIEESDGNQVYRNGYYGGDGVFAPTLAQAVPVSVPPSVTGIAMLAVLAPTVSGTVMDSGGVGLDDISVDLCKVTDIWDCVNPPTTFGGGNFQTVGVQPGTYTLFVRDSRDPAERASGYLTTAGTLVTDPLSADIRHITVGDTDVGPINVVIQDGGRISATSVKGSDPALGAYVIVCVSQEICYSGGEVDGSATFTSAPLIAGSYIVGVLTGPTRWYVSGQEATTHIADATGVTVDVGQTTPITVQMPQSFTELGTDVAVTPAYDGATNPVDLSFGQVDYPGTTTLTTSTEAPALPTGYQLSGSLFYNIETSAAYSGTITVCISLIGLSPVPTTMLHYDGADWQDVTILPIGADKICGATDSLSPFALVTLPSTGTQVVMGPQAMEGDLKVAMGSTLKVGYDFMIPKKHVAQTVSFAEAHVDFAYTCVAGPSTPKKVKPVGSGTLSVTVPNAAILDAANSSAWLPSAKQGDPSVYQGSLVLANGLCTANGLVRLRDGGTFFFRIASNGHHEKVSVRWHYSAAGSAGGWSASAGVTPD